MLLQQSIEYVSIVNTCYTYFVMYWCIYSGVSGQCSHIIPVHLWYGSNI